MRQSETISRVLKKAGNGMAALSFSSINYRKLCSTTQSLVIRTQCVEVLKLRPPAMFAKVFGGGNNNFVLLLKLATGRHIP
jgi:hypothetical protein